MRIAESLERESEFLSQLRGKTEGFAAQSLGGAGWTAAVCPELGGRICDLAAEGGPSVVDADVGIDVIPATSDYWKAAGKPFKAKRDGAAALTVSDAYGRGGTLTRDLRLTPEGLRIDTTLTPLTGQERTPAAVLRLGLDLGDAAALCVRVGNDDWQTIMAEADQTMAFKALALPAQPVRTLVLASPVTGRGVEVALGEAVLERLMVLCDVRNQRVMALAIPPASTAGREPIKATYTLRPVTTVPGVPQVKAPATHSAGRFVVEDCILPIARYGEWGEHVADPEAEDGRAAKLFGTHYEWCMHWYVDPAWFDPGVPYKLRMRIKVEKSGTPGKAFWAGVYDTLRRRGFGQIEPTVDTVADGYQWYDVATWTPETGQYIWAGPGQFDKKGGAASAVKAISIDRIELLRAP